MIKSRKKILRKKHTRTKKYKQILKGGFTDQDINKARLKAKMEEENEKRQAERWEKEKARLEKEKIKNKIKNAPFTRTDEINSVLKSMANQTEGTEEEKYAKVAETNYESWIRPILYETNNNARCRSDLSCDTIENLIFYKDKAKWEGWFIDDYEDMREGGISLSVNRDEIEKRGLIWPTTTYAEFLEIKEKTEKEIKDSEEVFSFWGSTQGEVEENMKEEEERRKREKELVVYDLGNEEEEATGGRKSRKRKEKKTKHKETKRKAKKKTKRNRYN